MTSQTMLEVIAVAACLASAASDWVEISQNHYRRPAETNTYTEVKDGSTSHHHPSEHGKIPYDYTGTENLGLISHPHKRLSTDIHAEEAPLKPNYRDQYDGRFYANHSTTEHNWNENKYRVPDIIRIDAGLKVKPNITPQFSIDIYETVTDNNKSILVTRNRVNEPDTAATIERVPNVGSVKRVQLSNTPVKSPSITKGTAIRRNDIKKHGPSPDDYSDEFDIKSNIFQTPDYVTDKTSYNNVKHFLSTTKDQYVFTSTKVTPVRSYDRIMTSTIKPNSKTSIIFNKYPTKHIQLERPEQQDNRTETINSGVYDSDSDTDIELHNTERKPFGHVNSFKNSNISIKPDNEGVAFDEVTVTNDGKNSSNYINKPRKPIGQISEDKNQKVNSNANLHKGEHTSEGVKVNTLESVLKFMKVVADTISKNSRRGVNGKVNYLNELKDTLLHSIKERIDATWPDDTSPPARRRSRAAAAQHSARGHVEFPSSESALMTISFLTFAVFLIKLVLQVIQTYKNKAMIMAPLVVATAGRAARQYQNSGR